MAQDVINLTLEPRKIVGKAVKHLRKAGKVPAVIHDHGQPSIIVEADSASLLKAYRQAGKHHPLTLNAGGKIYTAMIKNVEFEPRKNMLNHVVFNAVSADQVVEAEIPIEPKYNEGNEATPAERAGLIVLNNLESVSVEALPKDLPDVIYYDAEKLAEIGYQISVADLIVPPNVTIITENSHAVATVYEPSALAAANESAGGTAEEAGPVEEGEEGEEGEAVEGESGSEAESPATEGEKEESR
ncbi:MAG: 50S ribosomal protein L25 [Candidatus Saccharimonadales bacterium]